MKKGKRQAWRISVSWRAVRYVEDAMGFGKGAATSEQEANWILGHLAGFAIREVERFKRRARKGT